MKRFIVFFVTFSLLASLNVTSFADNPRKPAISPKKIMVHLKPDVTVRLNDLKFMFKDINGKTVYPIIYNGCTYLPIRAISALMGEPIEWDAASKTVFVGKTLSNPSKISGIIDTNAALQVSDSSDTFLVKASMDNAYWKPDVLVMYDFELQTLMDVDGNIVYPIIYNNSTYLPIRAISALMKEPIEWDGITKTIFIGDGENTPQESDKNEPEKEIGVNVKKIKSFFEREEVLYFEATAKTTKLKETIKPDEKLVIAASISENYINAQRITMEIKNINTADFNEKEIAAFNKTVDFAESTEYYILVLENIAYLAAQDMDYSMLAETFLYFAMDSQTKMEEARVSIQMLK